MFKSILFTSLHFTSLFLLTSSHTFAALIHADDFEVGENVGNLTSNASLTWLRGTGKKSPTKIFAPTTFYHQSFGGSTNNIFPGTWSEVHGSPNSYNYSALQIDFDTAVRSFGFKGENGSGTSFEVYTFDTEGKFVERLYVPLIISDTRWFPPNSPCCSSTIHAASTYLNFGYDVGMIKMGGFDRSNIYALDVDVPELSSIFLLSAGFFFLFVARRAKCINGPQQLA